MSLVSAVAIKFPSERIFTFDIVYSVDGEDVTDVGALEKRRLDIFAASTRRHRAMYNIHDAFGHRTGFRFQGGEVVRLS